MRDKSAWAWLLAVMLAAAPAALWSQQPEEAEGLEQDENRARIESADLLRYDAAQGMYYLTGNVVIVHKDIKLYCDKATYDYDHNSAVAEGNPRIVHPDITVTGDIIEANFDDEVATISGNVIAVTQRKRRNDTPQQPEGEKKESEVPRDLDELRDKLTTITCTKVVYRYNEQVKTVHATGRIKAVQEDKTLYADEALYEELKDIVTLTGDVRVVTEKGDEFRCPKAVISVEEDWLQAENIRGVGVRREEDQQQQ